VRYLTRIVSVTVVVVVIGIVVVTVGSKARQSRVGQSFTTWAMFRDGSRLPVGSQVVIAGVRVGEIDALAIEGRMARISMRLRNDVEIWDDAFAAKRASSLLGDSYIEILPGGPIDASKPDPARRRLVSGEPIPRVLEGGSTDKTLRAVETAMPIIDNAVGRASAFLLEARRTVSGPVAERMKEADEWVASGAIEAPLRSADRGVTAFEEGATSIAGATDGIAPRAIAAMDDFAADVAGAQKDMAQAQVDLVETLTNARKRMDELDPYLERARVATAELAGEPSTDPAAEQGTLARMINDRELGDDIRDATEAGADFTDGLDRLKATLGFRVEFNFFAVQPRFYVVAEIDARNDKFYVVELEKGALGVTDISLTDVPGSDQYVHRTVIEERLRFTAQFGKRWGIVRGRVGIKESTPGLGVDLLGWNGRLKLSADLFDATYDRAPRLKLAGALAVFRSVYVVAGIDDALNPGGYMPIAPWSPGSTTSGDTVPIWFEELHYGRDVFVGALLQFTDADLATLLRVYGAVFVAAL
jgi:phospholipid/cholesterol/gamma-HCH transport system substrate-binding protein